MQQRLEHKFVKSVPRSLELGILYISLDYATVVHSCCCGCGEEVVTPLSPTDWNMTFDGVAVSLSPSVGSWNLKCRSHYFIRNGKVIVAGSWSKEQIESEHKRDKHAKARFYSTSQTESSTVTSPPPARHPTPQQENWSKKLARWLNKAWG